MDENFIQFCRQATDTQLENILRKEYTRHKHGDYDNVRIAAAERGWWVKDGERIS